MKQNIWNSLSEPLKGTSQKHWFQSAFESIGVTRQDVADHLGINRSSYSRWVNGEARMRKDVLEKTLKFLELRGCPPLHMDKLRHIPTHTGVGKLLLRKRYGHGGKL